MQIAMTPSTARSTRIDLMGFDKAYVIRRVDRGQSLMLDVRFLTGESMACPYSHLLDMRLRGGQLVLHFAAKTVTIVGRNLKELYDVLLGQRIEAIQEQGERHDVGEEKETYIAKITVEDL